MKPTQNVGKKARREAKLVATSAAVVTLAFSLGSILFFIQSLGDVPLSSELKLVFDPLKFAVVALLVGFMGERLSSHLTNLSSEAERSANHEVLMEAVSTVTAVQRVGSSTVTMGDLVASIEQATRVRNTFLNFGGAPGPGTSEEQKIEHVYERYLSRSDSVTWHDIVSVNELHKFRHTRLFPKSKTPKQLGSHHIAVLRSSTPIINFIILFNADSNTEEVFFGWIYDDVRTTTTIYKSRDPELIKMYDRYFDVLWAEKSAETWCVDYSKPKDERGPRRRFVVDKAGTWVTAAIQQDGDTPKMLPLNYAALRIDFDQRDARIAGTIVGDNEFGNRRLLHTDVTEAPNKIFFEYEDHLSTGSQRGFCVYTFERHGGEDRIRGYLLESPRWGRIYLYGIKVSPEDALSWDVLNLDDARVLTGKYKHKLSCWWEEDRRLSGHGLPAALSTANHKASTGVRPMGREAKSGPGVGKSAVKQARSSRTSE